MNNTLIKIKYFGPWNLNKEEDYLNKMNQNGYEFIKRFCFIYKFKKVNNPTGTFKIDYRNFNREVAECLAYYKFMSELGLIRIDSSYRRHYFKILKDSNVELFSDKQSKLDLFKRLLKDSVILLLIWSLLIYFSIYSSYYVSYVYFKVDLLISSPFILFLLFYSFNAIKNYMELKRKFY